MFVHDVFSRLAVRDLPVHSENLSQRHGVNSPRELHLHSSSRVGPTPEGKCDRAKFFLRVLSGRRLTLRVALGHRENTSTRQGGSSPQHQAHINRQLARPESCGTAVRATPVFVDESGRRWRYNRSGLALLAIAVITIVAATTISIIHPAVLLPESNWITAEALK